jgi:predicted dithiol-disulfide oxidoreductase (DUF899 family)
MGWHFPLASSIDSDFNFDFHVSFTEEELRTGMAFHNYRISNVLIEEASGISVFYRSENGDVFHSYSSYGRGNEEVIGAYMYLDLTPKGRNENGPYYGMQDWVRPHDRYGAAGFVDATNRYRAEPADRSDCCHRPSETIPVPASTR